MSKFYRLILTVLIINIYISCSKESKKPIQVEYKEYNLQEIYFESNGLILKGDLYLPNETVKVPAIVIVGRSGQVDRDGNLITYYGRELQPIYKEWADFFSSKGIASLRYDKRILAQYGLNPLEITQEDQITDIISAITYLKTRTEIDTNKIFIIGHCEGGNIAPVAAGRINSVTGIIIINSPAFAIDTIFIEQHAANLFNLPELSLEIEQIFEQLRNNQLLPETNIFGNGVDYWREWIEYSEKADSIVLNLGKPIFIIQAKSHDYFPSFTLYRNISIWNNIVEQSENITFKTYQGVTHLIRNSDTNEISIHVLNDMLVWMNQI